MTVEKYAQESGQERYALASGRIGLSVHENCCGSYAPGSGKKFEIAEGRIEADRRR